jgi:hypothetical protein
MQISHTAWSHAAAFQPTVFVLLIINRHAAHAEGVMQKSDSEGMAKGFQRTKHFVPYSFASKVLQRSQ